MDRTALAAIVLLSVVSSLTDASPGRIYRIVRPPKYYDSWRQKRQSHPLATQVRIPEVAFADTVSLTDDSGGGPQQSLPPGIVQTQPLPAIAQQQLEVIPTPGFVQEPGPGGLADYLTPPPPEGEIRPTQQQDGKWELGFDANEILVPPADQVIARCASSQVRILDSRYDTLKLFTLVPSSAASPDDDSDGGFENAIQSVLEQTDSTAAGSSSHEFEYIPQRGSQRFQPPHRRPADPVYTYVKTDKHGHFKWGVRTGQ